MYPHALLELCVKFSQEILSWSTKIQAIKFTYACQLRYSSLNSATSQASGTFRILSGTINRLRIFSNNSRGWLFLFSHKNWAIIWVRRLFQILFTGIRALNILFQFIFPLNQKIITSNTLSMGFLRVPNLVLWLIFRARSVTDQFCWISLALQLDREGIKGRENCQRGDYSREAIILSISVKEGGGGWGNRGAAIIWGNTVFRVFEDHARTFYTYVTFATSHRAWKKILVRKFQESIIYTRGLIEAKCKKDAN